jgi:hypothetical protein
MPQTRDNRKLYSMLFLLIAITRGIRPIQARKPRLKLGKERTRRRDERVVKEKSLRNRRVIIS